MPLEAPPILQSSGCGLSELRAINGGNCVTRASSVPFTVPNGSAFDGFVELLLVKDIGAPPQEPQGSRCK
ncbi:hypothetical protein CCUS01_11688 [Colletotrichum cuscutae]|uniref:Uncharacterized protein n=1 Tax=Colletotrichum cuscutae TaxID=1209917 RepID=A0AAI9U2Q8_9PEZI|nr:hypothetical protein CCUS01_11688 [Colletotrichum cuscutae]